MKKTLLHVVGARPNFMKAAALLRALKNEPHFRSYLVHTGQHYDARLTDIFFEELRIHPDFFLRVGSSSHAVQTAQIMVKFEALLKRVPADLVVVYGDVNSTLACALVARKMHVRVAHVEAGLRSRDRRMPEEINRVLTDAVADILLTPSRDADINLRREGIDTRRVFFVGNTMIDTLLAHETQIQRSSILERLRLRVGRYAVLTLHRPSNVDSDRTLATIFAAIGKITRVMPVVFPVHPRTLRHLKGVLKTCPVKDDNLKILAPLRYSDFLKLLKECYCALTDSGGIQEETTFFRTPCLTLRENTERPVTVSRGTNVLAGIDPDHIVKVFKDLRRKKMRHRRPALWDGHASARIVKIFKRLI